jgi:hypothetical protein
MSFDMLGGLLPIKTREAPRDAGAGLTLAPVPPQNLIRPGTLANCAGRA